MKKQKKKLTFQKGFTMIELLIVIAIIGILAGVVAVSSGGGLKKANRASALTTLASVLPEMVACQDDGFGLNVYNVLNNVCTGAGHTVKWPNISKTGWSVVAGSATNAQIATYSFTATKTGETTITCSFAKNSCE